MYNKLSLWHRPTQHLPNKIYTSLQLSLYRSMESMESITNIDFKEIPQVFFKEERYNGEMVFINGYNGYTKAKGDSMLCAVINKSAFDQAGRPNYVTDKFGNQIHSENRRGQFVS